MYSTPLPDNDNKGDCPQREYPVSGLGNEEVYSTPLPNHDNEGDCPQPEDPVSGLGVVGYEAVADHDPG